jgi:hypothetical protein
VWQTGAKSLLSGVAVGIAFDGMNLDRWTRPFRRLS